ncbi:unnamed protein product [Caenorhabditis brenneri]
MKTRKSKMIEDLMAAQPTDVESVSAHDAIFTERALFVLLHGLVAKNNNKRLRKHLRLAHPNFGYSGPSTSDGLQCSDYVFFDDGSGSDLLMPIYRDSQFAILFFRIEEKRVYYADSSFSFNYSNNEISQMAMNLSIEGIVVEQLKTPRIYAQPNIHSSAVFAYYFSELFCAYGTKWNALHFDVNVKRTLLLHIIKKVLNENDKVEEKEEKKEVTKCEPGKTESPKDAWRKGRPRRNDAQFLAQNNIKRRSGGTFCKLDPVPIVPTLPALNTVSTVFESVQKALEESGNREDKKKLQRVKAILQETTKDSSESTSPEAASDESYHEEKPPQSTVLQTLTESQKRGIVQNYDRKKVRIRELMRVYGLSKNEKYARDQISRMRRQLISRRPNFRQAYRQLMERTGQMIAHADDVEMSEIHERDIEATALEQAICFGLKNFKASKFWNKSGFEFHIARIYESKQLDYSCHSIDSCKLFNLGNEIFT